MDKLAVILNLLAAGVPELIKLITEAVETAGKEDAQALRDRKLTISISYGGGEGEAVKLQRTVEAELPDGFDPDAE